MAKIIIPFPFRKFTDDIREVGIAGTTLAECIENLVNLYPGMKTIDDHPALLSIFINGKQNKNSWESVQLQDEDEVSLIIPIAGG